jgi:pyruvate formate lyase activating enzyme
MQGIITDIQRFSIHDGPGIRTLVFFKGCPLHCPWCSNPETQLRNPEIAFFERRCIACGRCVAVCRRPALKSIGAIDRERCDLCGECLAGCPSRAIQQIGETMSMDRLYNEVMKDEAFYRNSGGGVTFSGGEPLVQPEFLLSILERLQKANIHLAVETAGYAEWPILKEVAGEMDLFFYDLKILDSQKHTELLGADNAVILENLIKLSRLEVEIIIRIPVIPGYTDRDDNILNLLKFIASIRRAIKVELLPFHNFGRQKYISLGRKYSMGEHNSSETCGLDGAMADGARLGLDIKVTRF